MGRLTPDMTGGRGVRARTFPLAATFAIAALAAALVTLVATGRTSAETSAMIGFDVRPDSNRPAALGSLETCARADVGETFAVDVFVNNVTDLTKWELRVGYDARVLQLREANYNFFLASTEPGGNVFPTLFDAESDGRYFLAAAEVQGAPDSGSGVLARLTMTAVSEGASGLSVVSSPAVLGPQLTGAGGAPVGDSTGDGIWDGSYLDGEIVVGEDCDGDEPVVTPAPSPGPTTTPRPGEPTPRPGTRTPAPQDNDDDDGGSGTGDGADNDESDGHVVLVSEDGELIGGGQDPEGDASGDDRGEGSDGQGAGGSAAGSGNDGVGGDDPDDSDDSDSSGDENDRDDGDSTRANIAGTGGDGGSGTRWVIVGLAAAAAFVLAGGVLYGVSHRRSG